MKYPENFSLFEFINSNTANENGILNIPDFEHVENLLRLATLVLQPAREQLKRPILVTSGFRCPELNQAVGGKQNSQHLKGLAADIVCAGMYDLFGILCDNPHIDQLLFEDNGVTRWIHVSIAENGKEPRHEINGNYKAYLKK